MRQSDSPGKCAGCDDYLVDDDTYAWVIRRRRSYANIEESWLCSRCTEKALRDQMLMGLRNVLPSRTITAT